MVTEVRRTGWLERSQGSTAERHRGYMALNMSILYTVY